MNIRSSLPSVTKTVAQERFAANLHRASTSHGVRPQPGSLPPTTSEELLATLVRAGGRTVARQGHGVLVSIRRRLVFVPATHWVPEEALADVLRSAGLTPERFAELRAEAR